LTNPKDFPYVSGVRVMLDLCELNLFEQESGNDTKVWAGASDNTQVMNLIFSRDDISNRV